MASPDRIAAPPPPPAEAADPAANPLHGVIETLRPDRVGGWVVDRRDPAAEVSVEIRREGRLVATARADRPRPDLAAAGLGTGRYGFRATLDPPLDPGFEFTLGLTARAADGVALTLRPAQGAGPAPDPDRLLLERIHERLWDRDPAGPEPPPAGASGDLLALADRIDALARSLDDGRDRAARRAGAALWLAGAALAAALASLAAGVASLWG
jgi:hypothetical protein